MEIKDKNIDLRSDIEKLKLDISHNLKILEYQLTSRWGVMLVAAVVFLASLEVFSR
jgi:hypothetical protein